MDQHSLTTTRHALHGVAEFVLAGPQYDQSHSIRLRVTPDGFGTTAAPHLRVERLELVGPGVRLPLGGTCAELARAAGVEARTLRDVYADGPVLGLGDPVRVDPDAVDVLLSGYAIGDAALRAFSPDQEPVLWPEHFDVAVTSAEVNFGVSPGDTHLPEPYAYIGPWAPRRGDFWTTPFGAARPMTELPDVGSVVDFFRAGAQRAASDPPFV